MTELASITLLIGFIFGVIMGGMLIWALFRMSKMLKELLNFLKEGKA